MTDQPTEFKHPPCSHPGCSRVAHKAGHGHCLLHAYALGLTRQGVPAATVRDHLTACLAAGATYGGIGRECGVAPSTVSRIALGKTHRIRPDTADRLMHATGGMSHLVPAWPVQRRWRAWRSAGWTIDEISAACGVSPGTVYAVIGSSRKMEHIAQRVLDRTRAVWHTDDGHIRRRADPRTLANRWPLPAEWDNPDDPDEHPQIRRPGMSRRLSTVTA